MNDYQIKDLTERLVKLGYKRGASMSLSAGTLWSPDGVYFDICTGPVGPLPGVSVEIKPGWVSFVIIGPMHKTPLEYCEDVPGYRVAMCRALPPVSNVSEEMRNGILNRGFWQIGFQPFTEYDAEQHGEEKGA